MGVGEKAFFSTLTLQHEKKTWITIRIAMSSTISFNKSDKITDFFLLTLYFYLDIFLWLPAVLYLAI